MNNNKTNKSNNRGNNKGNHDSSSNESYFNDMLTMAIVVIVGVFIIYYLYTSYTALTTEKAVDPRPIPKCPTYWDVIEGSKCRNVHKIGKCRIGKPPEDTMDFSSDLFTNKKTGDYMKCKWAKECHAPWEGIDELCN